MSSLSWPEETDAGLAGVLIQESSDLRAENCDNADVSGLAQLHRDETIGFGVPEGTCSWGDRSAIVLLDDASHNILKLLV